MPHLDPKLNRLTVYSTHLYLLPFEIDPFSTIHNFMFYIHIMIPMMMHWFLFVGWIVSFNPIRTVLYCIILNHNVNVLFNIY
jgi:hypothetical protein